MEQEIAELKEKMGQKDEEIVGLKVQIGKLENNNRAIKRKLERFLFCIPNRVFLNNVDFQKKFSEKIMYLPKITARIAE